MEEKRHTHEEKPTRADKAVSWSSVVRNGFDGLNGHSIENNPGN